MFKVIFHDKAEKTYEDYETARTAAKASGRIARIYKANILDCCKWSLRENVYPGPDDDYSDSGCQPFTNVPVDLFSE